MEFLGVTANVLDPRLEGSQFELQSRYYVHFQSNILWKGTNLSYVLNKDDLGIK